MCPQWRLGDDLFEITELAGGAPDFKLAGVGNDGNTRGIVASIFEFTQAFDDDRNDLFGPM